MSDAEVRTAAEVLAMADARRLDPALVERALSSGAPHLRRMATLAIGQTGGRAMAPRLRELVSDPDTGVAANASFALGLLRDTAGVPALAGALDAPAPVAREAAWALGEVGEPARVAILAGLSAPVPGPSAPSQAVEARAELIVAASRLRPLPADALLPYLRVSANGDAAASSRLLDAAAYAFSRPRSAAGVRALAALAAQPGAEVRAHVARGLARSAAGDSLADAALAALSTLARDSDAQVRVNAVRSLATYDARARDALLAASADPDANVRLALAQSMGTVPLADRAEWMRLWNADTGFTYRSSLVSSALRTGVVLDAIDPARSDRWQLSSDWRQRAAAAGAGGAAAAAERAREISLPLTRDRDGRVRAAAFGAVGPWVDSAGPTRQASRAELLGTALQDEDEQVRATAIGALTRGARAAEVEPVVASYRLAGSDSGNDARLAAIRFLSAAWRNDSAAFTPVLRDMLRALPEPSDPLERAAGRASPLFAHWSAAAGGTPRPIAWYEGVVRSAIVPSIGIAPPAAEIVTERGTITIELFGADAPLTVTNFLTLARSGFYRDTRFHRVVPNFVAQDGDPRGDGSGGPGYAIRDELNRRRYERGVVGMALSGPDTGGSQYFLTHSPQPHLDGHYTVFGRVVGGMDVLDRIVQGDRILEVRAR